MKLSDLLLFLFCFLESPMYLSSCTHINIKYLPASLGPLKSSANSPLRKIFRVGYPVTPYLEHTSVLAVQSTCT
jgi:hypothetical protein